MAASIGEYTNLGLPGLATATGTRVDSAAKHIMACKVDAKRLFEWSRAGTNDNSAQYMHAKKLMFCMHKDELVMNTTNSLTNNNSHMHSTQAAYPLVVTTLAEMPHSVIQLLSILYSSQDMTEFNARAHQFAGVMTNRARVNPFDRNAFLTYVVPTADTEKTKRILSSLPDLRCQGVALGQAFPSYMSGDSVASVLIGGMVTIANGAWEMCPGDIVQWYIDEEEEFFWPSNQTEQNQHHHRVGSRKHISSAHLSDALQHTGSAVDFATRWDRAKLGGARSLDASFREGWSNRNMGFDHEHNNGYGSGNALYGKKDGKMVFRIKSYKPALFVNAANTESEVHDVYGDKVRIFAKCITGGRAFDQVDIMIMTQSS